MGKPRIFLTHGLLKMNNSMALNLPLMIVMTPVRNEAWVLPAFLKATSLWADYIIVADQMSTDGSRELLQQYDKVIMIDNNNPDFNEAERQSMLIQKAREVANGNDAILFGLDADEVFSLNFKETDDWQRIIHSKPGDVFWFKWAEIAPDKKHYGDSRYYPWMFHDDGKEPHGNYVRNMHSMRIPYPIEEKQMFYVNDFKVLHLAYLNEARVLSKCRFYKFVDWELNKRNVIKLSRAYNYSKNLQQFELPHEYVDNDQYNVLDNVDSSSKFFWFDDYVAKRIKDYNHRIISKLDIWDNAFMESQQIKDPRNFWDKLVQLYLRKTIGYENIVIRIIDKMLQKIY